MRRFQKHAEFRRLLARAFVIAAAWAQPQAVAELPDDRIARVEAAIQQFMSKQHIPAISVAIVRDGQICFNRGYGLADLENRVPAGASTVYLYDVRIYAARRGYRRCIGDDVFRLHAPARVPAGGDGAYAAG